MQLPLRYIWPCFLYALGFCTIWMAASFTAHLIIYSRYVHHSRGAVVDKGIIEFDENDCCVCVDFSYDIDGEPMASQHMLKQHYPNVEAALDALADMEGELDVWWYGPKTEPVVTIERSFPYKEGVRFMASLGVFLYFLWFGTFVRRRQLMHNF